jgi:hypothetical protein
VYRQLPEFGRLAYPVRAEVTKHVLPGRKSPGCPAAVRAEVGTTCGATQTWRPEHKEISAAPKFPARMKSFQADNSREADPSLDWGRPMTQRKKQVNARCGTAGVRDQASKERFSEITSGRSGGQQGLDDNLQRLLQRGKTEVEESPLRLAHESIRARKEE